MAAWSYLDLLKDMMKHNKTQPIVTRLAIWFAMTLNCISVFAGHGTPVDLTFGIINVALSLLVVGMTAKKQGIAGLASKVPTAHKICLAISAVGTVLFVTTGKSDVGVAFAIGADIAAFLPTILECWARPQTQPSNAYLIGLAAAGMALWANLFHGDLQVTAYFTIYLVLIDTFIPSLIFIRKGILKATLAKQLQPES